MSNKIFLLQGLTADTHLTALKELLSPKDLELAVLSVAFVTKSGVDLISQELHKAGERVDVFAGIRNDITSKEGLLTLLEAGVNLHYVDTGARTLVFHPKVYLSRRKTEAKVMIGSANLTLGGIHNNIESSVLLDLDTDNDEDSAFLASIIDEFHKLLVKYPRHVIKLREAKQIELLYKSGLLISEASSSPPNAVARVGSKTDEVPRMSLAVEPIRKVLDSVLSSKNQNSTVSDDEATGQNAATPEYSIVWRSKSLTRRDLGIPTGKNTHATGSINLDKGLLPTDVDHRHYFRDEVFQSLDWRPTKKKTVDEAYATVGLIVKGVDRGEFLVRVAHTNDSESATYKQHNAMSRLSWGEMQPYVALPTLIDRTLTLFRDQSKLTRFLLEID